MVCLMLNPAEEVIQRLVDSGLDEKEANIAVSMAGRSPMKASQIGKLVGVSRMDAYNTLKRLQEKGMIKSTVDKPMRFAGLTIAEIFHQLINREEAELRRLRNHLEELESGPAEAFISIPPEVKEATFTVIKDSNHIQAAMERMVDDSEDEIIMMLGRWGILHLVRSGCIDALNNAAVRGVRVRVIAVLEEKNSKFLDKLDDAIEVRHCNDSNAGISIFDDDAAIQLISIEENPVGRGKNDSALVVESQGYNKAQRELIDALWADAIDINSARSKILQGNLIEPLKVVLGEGSFYQRLKDGIQKLSSVPNAVLRNKGEIIGINPQNMTLDLMGISFDDLMRNIGNRIGEEIATSASLIDDSENFNDELQKIWNKLGMGQLILEGNPPNSITVIDSKACQTGAEMGRLFCHLDEGILEGIMKARHGYSSISVKRNCPVDGSVSCQFEIQLLKE